MAQEWGTGDPAYEAAKHRAFELLRQGLPLNGEQERLSLEEIHERTVRPRQ